MAHSDRIICPFIRIYYVAGGWCEVELEMAVLMLFYQFLRNCALRAVNIGWSCCADVYSTQWKESGVKHLFLWIFFSASEASPALHRRGARSLTRAVLGGPLTLSQAVCCRCERVYEHFAVVIGCEKVSDLMAFYILDAICVNIAELRPATRRGPLIQQAQREMSNMQQEEGYVSFVALIKTSEGS